MAGKGRAGGHKRQLQVAFRQFPFSFAQVCRGWSSSRLEGGELGLDGYGKRNLEEERIQKEISYLVVGLLD